MKNTGLLFLSFSFWVVIYGQDSSTVPTQKAKPLVFTFVENNPHFPGGDKALHKFIEDNLQYPKDFKEKGIQQKVLISFVVNEDGSTSDAEVIRSSDPTLNAEAIRVIGMLPHFIPGQQQGHLVKVYFNVPIIFGADIPVSPQNKEFNDKMKKDEYFNKAVALAGNGSYKEALKLLKKSISKYPTDYLGYQKSADYELVVGDIQEACKNYSKAKSLGSSTTDDLLIKNCH